MSAGLPAPGGPPDACAGVDATATIRATDSAKGGPEVLIIYDVCMVVHAVGVWYYLWGSGACGTALFALKYAILRRKAGTFGSDRGKLTFYRLN